MFQWLHNPTHHAALFLHPNQGPEFSCYTLAHEGVVVAHADTPAALSNLNYANSNHPGIWEWVNTFVKKTGVSGQVRGKEVFRVADAGF
jgi:hypothetical protein